jgi:hypothetical protein
MLCRTPKRRALGEYAMLVRTSINDGLPSNTVQPSKLEESIALYFGPKLEYSARLNINLMLFRTHTVSSRVQICHLINGKALTRDETLTWPQKVGENLPYSMIPAQYRYSFPHLNSLKTNEVRQSYRETVLE